MKRIKIIAIIIALTLCLTCLFGCGNGKEYQIKTDLTINDIDDNYRTFYEIFVGGYSDSDNNGYGDIKGIINRLDYLNDGDSSSGLSLGVTGLWLMPIMPSPSYHKYDCSDYYEIDKKYGTMEDFETLLAEAKSRNIKIIIDLVLNHTSTRHQWFKSCKQAIADGDLTNKYASYYSLSTKSQSGYTQLAKTPSGVQYYYECNFSTEMPELNMDNPDVREEIVNIAKFWLDKGVGGFRLDAVKYVYIGNDTKNVEFWKWFNDECKKIKSDVYLVGENWSSDVSIFNYYQALNCFDFGMSGSGGEVSLTAKNIQSVNQYVASLAHYKDSVIENNPNAILNPFITNHDMDRAAGFLPVKDNLMQMAANLYILTYGSPFIYYGEEIGMLGSRGSASTDSNRRLAMLWGDKDTVRNPVGSTYNKEQVNGTVKEQVSEKNSLYNHYKKLIMIRNANPEIARGDYTALKFDGYNGFGGFLSTYQNKTVGVFHNVTDTAVTIDLKDYTDMTFEKINGFVGEGTAKLDGTVLTLDGYTSAVLR